MGLDSVGTVSQPAPVGQGQDVTDLVLQDLKERREAGTKKYGTPLKTFNGRNALVDAYQEALDLVVYLRQLIEEEERARTKLDSTESGDAMYNHIKRRLDEARFRAELGLDFPEPLPDESLGDRRAVGPSPEKPSVEIELTDKITVRLVQKVGGDHMIVAAAKVSVSGEEALEFATPGSEEANAGLIDYLVHHRHGSCFEHSSLTFFVHAPIFVWREWHRHRLMSYNETSARYRKLEPVFWVPRADRKLIPAPGHTSARPKFMAGDPVLYQEVCNELAESYRASYAKYEKLLNKGIAKEVARAALPVGIYSSCWVTCNSRSLMHFLSLRTHEPESKFVSYPQAEIEQAARACEQIFAEGWPLTYKAFVGGGRVAP